MGYGKVGEGMKEKRPIRKDEWAIVLDFLSHGHSSMERSQPVAHVIGEDFFSLLEVIIRDDVSLKMGDRLYIGDGKRDKVKYIRGRIGESWVRLSVIMWRPE